MLPLMIYIEKNMKNLSALPVINLMLVGLWGAGCSAQTSDEAFLRTNQKTENVSKESEVEMSEHSVKIIVPLSSEFGSIAEREAISALGRQVDTVLQSTQAGEYDGDEYGDGGATLYLYGQDADKVYAAIKQVLAGANLPKGSYAQLRYGAPNDPTVKSTKVSLGKP